MLFHDRATIEGKARITREGHFIANARVARANNIQDYRPDELGLQPKADGTPYRIFRPEASIFDEASLSSALHRPVVLGHPGRDVDATNWKKLSVGDTGGKIMRDGEVMVVPVMIMDADGVEAIQTTHPEFSWGYSADLNMTPGKFGDEAYDGSITPPRYNHLAACPRARGGSDLRITDSLVIIDERPEHLRDNQEPRPMKIQILDSEVDLSDGAAVALAVGKVTAKLADAEGKVTSLTTDLGTANTTVQTRDGEIVALKQQLKDAEITPAKLQDMADARAKVLTDAKAIAGDKLGDVAGKTDAEIRKAALASTAIGDAALTMSDAAIEGAFAAFAVGAAPTKQSTVPSGKVVIGDASDARATRDAALAKANDDRRNAYKGAN